jgi:nucleotide-binding universal stress UspA family protein
VAHLTTNASAVRRRKSLALGSDVRFHVTAMHTILACLDLSATSESVLECALSLLRPDGQLVMLHVCAPEPEFVGYGIGPQSVRDAVAGELRAEHRQLQALATPLASRGLAVTPLTIQGTVVECIVEHATRLDAAFVVVASKGRSAVAEWFAGSVVHELLRRVAVPVVVVPTLGNHVRG